ncbi:MAG: acyltransferase [Parasporobacterium sp.]|nr:acyltransferase [Parasporobacterium sp.]
MNKRNCTIDFLKFIFTLIIVLFHSNVFLEPIGLSVLPSGRLAVEFFFLVSGYLMASSFYKNKDKTISTTRDTFYFIKGKICRLMPDYIIAWIISFVILHILTGNTGLRKLALDVFNSIPELTLISYSGIAVRFYLNPAWYISAMLLAMCILYPLMRRYRSTFFVIIAPLAFLFIEGYILKNYGNLTGPDKWTGWCLLGTIRAIAELCGGCVCFRLSLYLKTVNFTKLSKTLFTIAEWLLYIFSVVWMFSYPGGKQDFLIVIVFAAAVTITFSDISYDYVIFRGRFFTWLGTFSFPLFLAHHPMRYSLIYPESWGPAERMILYLVMTAASALFIMYISRLIRYLWKRNKDKIRAKFVA